MAMSHIAGLPPASNARRKIDSGIVRAGKM